MTYPPEPGPLRNSRRRSILLLRVQAREVARQQGVEVRRPRGWSILDDLGTVMESPSSDGWNARPARSIHLARASPSV